VNDLVICQRGNFHCEFDSTTMAVCGIGSELWDECGIRHKDSAIQFVIDQVPSST
jgi:hypothetical protein